MPKGTQKWTELADRSVGVKTLKFGYHISKKHQKPNFVPYFCWSLNGFHKEFEGVTSANRGNFRSHSINPFNQLSFSFRSFIGYFCPLVLFK